MPEIKFLPLTNDCYSKVSSRYADAIKSEIYRSVMMCDVSEECGGCSCHLGHAPCGHCMHFPLEQENDRCKDVSEESKSIDGEEIKAGQLLELRPESTASEAYKGERLVEIKHTAILQSQSVNGFTRDDILVFFKGKPKCNFFLEKKHLRKKLPNADPSPAKPEAKPSMGPYSKFKTTKGDRVRLIEADCYLGRTYNIGDEFIIKADSSNESAVDCVKAPDTTGNQIVLYKNRLELVSRLSSDELIKAPKSCIGMRINRGDIVALIKDGSYEGDYKAGTEFKVSHHERDCYADNTINCRTLESNKLAIFWSRNMTLVRRASDVEEKNEEILPLPTSETNCESMAIPKGSIVKLIRQATFNGGTGESRSRGSKFRTEHNNGAGSKTVNVRGIYSCVTGYLYKKDLELVSSPEAKPEPIPESKPKAQTEKFQSGDIVECIKEDTYKTGGDKFLVGLRVRVTEAYMRAFYGICLSQGRKGQFYSDRFKLHKRKDDVSPEEINSDKTSNLNQEIGNLKVSNLSLLEKNRQLQRVVNNQSLELIKASLLEPRNQITISEQVVGNEIITTTSRKGTQDERSRINTHNRKLECDRSKRASRRLVSGQKGEVKKLSSKQDCNEESTSRSHFGDSRDSGGTERRDEGDYGRVALARDVTDSAIMN